MVELAAQLFATMRATGVWVPTSSQLVELLRVALAASLGTEEGRPAIFTLRLEPQTSEQGRAVAPHFFGRNEDPYFRFASPKKLDHRDLIKLFSGTRPGSSAIRVGPTNARREGDLYVLGIDPMVRGLVLRGPQMRIEVVGPGRLLVKAAHATLGCIADGLARTIDIDLYSRGIDGLLGINDPGSRMEKIASDMLTHGHGGTLLIVATEPVVGIEFHNRLDKSLLLGDALADRVAANEELELGLSQRPPGDNSLPYAAMMRADQVSGFATDRVRRYLETIARLTAVDGATVVTTGAELLGFGEKIESTAHPEVERTSPERDAESEIVSLGALGGTRHQSAARFVADNPGSNAIVASQDGTLSLMRRQGDKVDCLAHLEWLG